MAGTSGGMSIAGNKFEGFKTDANEAIHFKLVRQEADVFDDSMSFNPDMTHQLFGESESIFGYKDLKIGILCTASQMTTYVNIDYTDKISPQKSDGVYADDVMKVIREKMDHDFLTNKDQFIASIEKDTAFKPFGELIHSYTVQKDNKDLQYEIYKHNIDVPGFREYHARIQPFLLFYVDAASYIDVDDERWMFFMLYEKYESDGKTMHAFVGYMTVYNYYAYPEKIRPRISQVLVMPPFQKQGHGATLIQTFYNDCYARSEVLDITVEDPSENFQRVRDFVDAKNCLALKTFQPERLRQGFSEDMINEAKEKLRINKKQARRIYEILRLKATNFADKEELKSYRLDIKKRLNVPFQKNGRDFEKLQRALNPNELAATLNNMSTEQKMEFLEKTFQECVTEYRQILERVARSST